MGVLPRTRRRRIRDSRDPSRPSVTAGQPPPGSCMVHVHAKTALTEPVRHQVWQRSGSREGFWVGQPAATSPEEGPLAVTSTRASRCQAPCSGGSQAGSHTDERPYRPSDLHGQPTGTRPRSGTDLNGSGCPYGYLRIGRLYTGFHRLIVRCFDDVPVIPSAHQRCRRFAVPWPRMRWLLPCLMARARCGGREGRRW